MAEGWVVGLDISDEMIRRARRNNLELENVMFVIAAVEEIPWDANFFTHAISVEATYYWPDPRSALREIHRALRRRLCVDTHQLLPRKTCMLISGPKFWASPRTCIPPANGPRCSPRPDFPA